jgi:hypothetical protein
MGFKYRCHSTPEAMRTARAYIYWFTPLAKAAIDHENLAGDKAGRIRREKNGRARQLFNFSKSLHRRPHFEFVTAVACPAKLFH